MKQVPWGMGKQLVTGVTTDIISSIFCLHVIILAVIASDSSSSSAIVSNSQWPRMSLSISFSQLDIYLLFNDIKSNLLS